MQLDIPSITIDGTVPPAELRSGSLFCTTLNPESRSCLRSPSMRISHCDTKSRIGKDSRLFKSGNFSHSQQAVYGRDIVFYFVGMISKCTNAGCRTYAKSQTLKFV